MRTISLGLAAVVTLALFGAFGSLVVTSRPTVDARVASMHAVLPDGALVDLTGA